MSDNNNGSLVISLDFELLWGVFDVIDYRKKKDYFINTRTILPQILRLFEKYEVKATWATVGMLFNENWEEWEENMPEVIPDYTNQNLSAYSFGKSIKLLETEKLCFAPDLIKKIAEVPGQEVATHTYSHYYCLEQGQNKVSFKYDLEAAISIAAKLNISLSSLVFPRNQLENEYLEICKSLGILCVRSNPSSWYWSDTMSSSLITKLARTGDAYLPLGRKSYSLPEIREAKNMPMEQKASRFLRPVEKNQVLRKAKLSRIFNEMTSAARRREFYHLWWHPHNFGDQPQESLDDLELILQHYTKLKGKYSFLSRNMAEIGKVMSHNI